ncbi:scramblase [Peziza echinospora]|nr:scramblase [Peziza echinospora]
MLQLPRALRSISRTTLPTRISNTPNINIRTLASLRRPGPSSSLRRRPRAERVVFRDEIEAAAAAKKEEHAKPSGIIDNSLLAPVHIPEDPLGVLKHNHPAARLLENSGLVIQRQLELGNLLLGFEQANKYVIMDPSGAHIGFIAEEDTGIGRVIARQWFRTHRAFTTHVFDKDQNEVLTFRRPFSFINSRIRALDPITRGPGGDPTIIGEAQQEWHLFRRKYNLFLHHDPPTSTYSSPSGSQLVPPPTTPLKTTTSTSTALQISPDGNGEAEGGGGVFTQFAYVDEPFLSWDFSLLSANNELLGSVNRNFAGFGREIFTDTGVYALRMDSASAAAEPRHLISNTHRDLPTSSSSNSTHGSEKDMGKEGDGTQIVPAATRGMTLDERAVMLATAVTIDFDYFSRHSRHGGGLGFFPFFGMGGGGGEFTDSEGNVVPSGGVGGGGGGMEGMQQGDGYDEDDGWGQQQQQQQQQQDGGGGGGNGGGGGDYWPWE